MDNIFKTRKVVKSTFKFDKRIAGIFDDMIRRSVPSYTEIQRMILELTLLKAQTNSNIYDLGCSTGRTLVNIAKNLNRKEVKIIGVDYSDAMLERSWKKLRRYGVQKNCKLLKSDINENLTIRNASVVIMCLTLQFINPKKRKVVLENIFKGMKKGGCFILIEKLFFSDPMLEKIYTKAYYNFKMRQGYSKLEIYKKQEALMNVLIPFEYGQNIRLLRASGFKVIGEFFRWYNFCGILAIKK